MIVVTGAAGFIGSNIVAALNELGVEVVVCDRLDGGDKWLNLRKAVFADFVLPEDIDGWLRDRRGVEAVIHMGAISSTTIADGDQAIEQNFRFPMRLLDICTAQKIAFLYASSAAVYGDGDQGFDDDMAPDAIRRLRPLNLYGWTKRQFDYLVATRLAMQSAMPPQCAGFRFFNVFGPNEYHKGDMQSVVAKIFPKARAGIQIELFKSHRTDIADGDQRRDFVYVKDVVAVVLWFLKEGRASGIFNLGSGVARSFKELAEAVFDTLDVPRNIDYVDMPTAIRDKYQYHTQASLDRLRQAGYRAPFMPLEAAIADYVTGYLAAPDRYR